MIFTLCGWFPLHLFCDSRYCPQRALLILRNSTRPLIFVAHSLGGLLIKQALIESSKQDRDGRDRNLHKACRAVIFFGTPHRGSPHDASLGLVVASIAKMAQFDINKSILRDLDPRNGSPTLGTLLDDFNSLLVQENIQVYTFQESAGKMGFGPFAGKVDRLRDSTNTYAELL